MLLVAVGLFNSAGGTPAETVAAWNGSAWQALGSGIPVGAAFCMETLHDGRMVVSGSFPVEGGVQVNRIRVWDGLSWTDLNGGLSTAGTSSAFEMVVMASGDLIVVGEFSIGNPGVANHITRWNGDSWGPVGEQGNRILLKLMLCPAGRVGQTALAT